MILPATGDGCCRSVAQQLFLPIITSCTCEHHPRRLRSRAFRGGLFRARVRLRKFKLRLDRSQRTRIKDCGDGSRGSISATQPIYTDASAIVRDAADLRGYHVAEPADVSSEQYLGSWVVFACVIKAIVSVIKVWSSLHVPSGIRQMCVVFDSDAVVFQCTLVCRENDIPRSEAVAAAVYRSKEVLSYLYAISLASAWVAAIGSRGRHDIVNPSRQRKAYRQPCYCDARKHDLPVNQFALRGLPPCDYHLSHP